MTRPENSCLVSQVDFRKCHEVECSKKVHYLFGTCSWFRCSIDLEENRTMTAVSQRPGTSKGEVPAGNGSFSASAKIEVPEPWLPWLAPSV